MKYLKIIILLICCLILSFSPATLDIERSPNLKCLDFEFLPPTVDAPIIKLNCSSLKKITDDEMIIIYERVKYTWKNKTTLYKENKNLGNYTFLCITWATGYCFVY